MHTSNFETVLHWISIDHRKVFFHLSDMDISPYGHFFPFCYYVEDEFHKSFPQVIAGKSYTHVYSG